MKTASFVEVQLGLLFGLIFVPPRFDTNFAGSLRASEAGFVDVDRELEVFKAIHACAEKAAFDATAVATSAASTFVEAANGAAGAQPNNDSGTSTINHAASKET